ncbi:hypothetical protein [Geothrix sp. PMB-07]|uniref:hypothetical protein n=1 Tax=Geothrix sp. PMB-07 TaxID=3068640 RepID=UPI002742621D|nr:hypothetical protein [Geothrix sp. PMB-07]WLT32054.1 hypothetical protein Q9293_01745 [Geothrix sp. PMB-07]
MSDPYLSQAPGGLIPAPGAKAAKVCGILAIVLALTCAGIPIAIILGIVALVQQGKAKRLAKAQPEVYAPVSATGLVTGIIGLVLPVLMIPFVGIVSAVAIPALLVQRERAREVAVQSNLNVARARAEAALQAIHAKAPGQVPSQDAIIQALAQDPLVQALKNPLTPGAPALQRGTTGPLGTVMVFSDQEQEGGVTTWTLQFRATVKLAGQEKILQEELVTHTQEQVQGRTEDGWEVVQPAPEAPAPTPAPQQ